MTVTSLVVLSRELSLPMLQGAKSLSQMQGSCMIIVARLWPFQIKEGVSTKSRSFFFCQRSRRGWIPACCPLFLDPEKFIICGFWDLVFWHLGNSPVFAFHAWQASIHAWQASTSCALHLIILMHGRQWSWSTLVLLLLATLWAASADEWWKVW